MSSVFISDLHLAADAPQLVHLFLKFLQGPAQQAEEIYILGDWFEVWLGDDAIPDDVAKLLAQVKQLNDGRRRLYFMAGNRDFLIGERFAQLSGMHILTDPCVREIQGTPTLLMHGDLLCTDDVEYQAFRQQVRDPQWQQQFLALSIEERIAMARQARDASQTQTREKADDIMDANQATVEAYFREYGVKRMIHGHTHRPGVHRFQVDGNSVERIVLGDWREDISMLSVDADDFRLTDPRVSS